MAVHAQSTMSPGLSASMTEWAAPTANTAVGESLRLGYGALRRQELAVKEDEVLSTFEVGQSSRSVSEQHGAERVFALRKPTL
nr:hypothetical protein [Tanacetum cinerariifolium]